LTGVLEMKNKININISSITENVNLTETYINKVLSFEKSLSTLNLGIDIREEITGPLVDKLYSDNSVLRKQLKDGTIFDFYYRSKIARDFVMSEPRIPDHAWEPQTSRLLSFFSEKAKNIIVGGAYFGDQAILMAKKIKQDGGLVHAFEPNPEQREMLAHNARLNNLENIIINSEGLWDDDNTKLFLEGYDSFAHPVISNSITDDSFSTITIKTYTKIKGIEDIDLIMLDIEGAEYKALLGAFGFLEKSASRAPVIIFEVHRHYVDWSDGLENAELLKKLKEVGYQIYAIRDFNSNYDMTDFPIELIKAENVYLEGPPHGFNMLAIKDPELIKNEEIKIVQDVSPKYLRHKDPLMHHPIGGLKK